MESFRTCEIWIFLMWIFENLCEVVNFLRSIIFMINLKCNIAWPFVWNIRNGNGWSIWFDSLDYMWISKFIWKYIELYASYVIMWTVSTFKSYYIIESSTLSKILVNHCDSKLVNIRLSTNLESKWTMCLWNDWFMKMWCLQLRCTSYKHSDYWNHVDLRTYWCKPFWTLNLWPILGPVMGQSVTFWTMNFWVLSHG